MSEPKCSAVSRVKRKGVNHTVECGKPAGHHLAAEWDDAKHESAPGEAVNSIWGGAPSDVPGDQRWRYEKPKFDAKAYTKQWARTYGEE